MQGHIESDYLLLFAKILEIHKVVALVAINNKQPIDPNRLCMHVEVVELGKQQIVVSLASRTNINDLVL